MAKAATPWGGAAVLEEILLPQEADGKEFAALVQLLEGPHGERLVRFAYATGGVARRGPVTLRPTDVAKLRRGLRKTPDLGKALRLGSA